MLAQKCSLKSSLLYINDSSIPHDGQQWKSHALGHQSHALGPKALGQGIGTLGRGILHCRPPWGIEIAHCRPPWDIEIAQYQIVNTSHFYLTSNTLIAALFRPKR